MTDRNKGRDRDRRTPVSDHGNRDRYESYRDINERQKSPETQNPGSRRKN